MRVDVYMREGGRERDQKEGRGGKGRERKEGGRRERERGEKGERGGKRKQNFTTSLCNGRQVVHTSFRHRTGPQSPHQQGLVRGE